MKEYVAVVQYIVRDIVGNTQNIAAGYIIRIVEADNKSEAMGKFVLSTELEKAKDEMKERHYSKEITFVDPVISVKNAITVIK